MYGCIKARLGAPSSSSRGKRQQSEQQQHHASSGHVDRFPQVLMEIDSSTMQCTESAYCDISVSHLISCLTGVHCPPKRVQRSLEPSASRQDFPRRGVTWLMSRSRADSLAKAQSLESQGRMNEARECYTKCLDITPEMAFQLIKVSSLPDGPGNLWSLMLGFTR